MLLTLQTNHRKLIKATQRFAGLPNKYDCLTGLGSYSLLAHNLCKNMKKISMFLAMSFVVLSFGVFAQLKVNSLGNVQVDYTSGGQLLTFGPNAGPGYPEWGKWSIEDFDGGLNFYKAWPYSDYGSYKLFIKDNGYVGINTGTPSYRLDVNGDIATYGTLRISSDERFKTDIKPITGSIDNLLKLEGVTYKMNKTKKIEYDLSSIKDPEQRKAAESEMALYDPNAINDRYGFIAQKVKEVYPELVDQDKEGYLNVDYIGLIPVLVEAIKDQQAQIKNLSAQIEECCKNNLSLKSASIATGTTDNLAASQASLDLNIPNPFSQEARIGCTIPESSTSSVLYIYNMNGVQLQQYNVNGKGKQSVTINGSSFQPGMYLYALVIDGKEVDTKRMILTK